jgi:hypothetical protein
MSDRDPDLNSPIIGPMHSLEPEYLELNAEGLIDEAATSRAVALERGSIFSVFEEVRFALYAAVAAITTGVGILVKENLDHIGPLTLIVTLALVAAACYGAGIRTRLRRETRTIGGDYLLLLGALIMSADLGYAESQFHWLGSHWSWYLLTLAALHATTAYALDSRLVLSVSLTSLAGWFGVEGHIQNLFQLDNSIRNSGFQALACASVIFVWREVHGRLDGPPQFKEVFQQFAANLGFWGALALCFTPNSRLPGVVVLIVLAVASIRKGLQNSQEIFVIYGIAYTALGLCFVESQIVSGLLAALLELATVIVAVILLWRLRHLTNAGPA